MGAFIRPAAQVYRVAGISTLPGAKLVVLTIPASAVKWAPRLLTKANSNAGLPICAEMVFPGVD
jgi:hypothetical protein